MNPFQAKLCNLGIPIPRRVPWPPGSQNGRRMTEFREFFCLYRGARRPGDVCSARTGAERRPQTPLSCSAYRQIKLKRNEGREPCFGTLGATGLAVTSAKMKKDTPKSEVSLNNIHISLKKHKKPRGRNLWALNLLYWMIT